jgi:hypothetical protein
MPTARVLLAVAIAFFGCKEQPGQESDTAGLKAPALQPAIPAGSCPALSAQQASKLVQLSLHCADREYPNKPSNILDGDETVLPPRKLTPSFFGCFDWHSAVHGHWTMVRILRLFPDLPEAHRINEILDSHLTAELIAREMAYFEASRNKTFERPYGWGWMLRLQAELVSWNCQRGSRLAAAVGPLATLLAGRMASYLKQLSFPIRAGTHTNTAFAMVHAWDYGEVTNDREFLDVLAENARRFYLQDTHCPADYEPSGEDFISPCLAEADIMRRVLEPTEFTAWFDAFLSKDGVDLENLLLPPEVRDPEDPKIGHLIGLHFHRAWTMRGMASALADDHPMNSLFTKSAAAHCEAGSKLVFESGYGGSHWLASFAVYLLTDQP